MIRLRCALVLLVLSACDAPPPDPPALPPCTIAAGDGERLVWGLADLHAHPVSHLSFDQQLLWGAPDGDGELVTSAEHPRPTPCPVDTHTRGDDPLQRTAHSLILGLLNQQASFAHGPIGAASPDAPTATAWPNARDVVHQQMHVNAIRRAYEGGLRLMVAAVTDNQALAQLLRGPRFPGPISPSRAAERASAERQLEAIAQLVARHSAWMEIARTPADARRIIGEEGKLALVLALEMDALSIDDIRALVEEHGVAQVTPIHIVDNDFGGAATYGEIFNAANAYLSPIFRDVTEPIDGCPVAPLAYQCMAPPDAGGPVVAFRQSWPLMLVEGDAPLIFLPGKLPYRYYRALGYDSLDFCESPDRAVAERCVARVLHGHRNVRGLRDGGAPVRELMQLGVVVDVSHSSWSSVEHALALTVADPYSPAAPYPLVASHGAVSPTEGVIDSERDLDLAHARAIVERGGVIGYGVGGRLRPRLVERWVGGPLVRVCTGDACAPRACFGTESSGARCASPASVDLDRDVEGVLRVEIDGAPVLDRVTPGAVVLLAEAVVRLGCDEAPIRLQAPLSCDADPCVAEMGLGDGSCGASMGGRIERLSVRWLETAECGPEGLGDSRFDVLAARASVGRDVIAELAPGERPVARLTRERGELLLVDEPDACTAGGDRIPRPIARLAVRTAPGAELGGASIGRFGAELCAAIALRDADGTCPGIDPLAADAARCAAPFVSINHRGAWAAGSTVATFFQLPGGAEVDDVCEVGLAIVSADEAPAELVIDEVRLEAVADPVRTFAADYQRLLDALPGDASGTIAIGTDANGGPPLLAISRDDPPEIQVRSDGCGSRLLRPMRVDGRPIRMSERGLATYGQLADLLEAIERQGRYDDDGTRVRADDVLGSMLRSAEGYLRAWERSRRAAGIE